MTSSCATRRALLLAAILCLSGISCFLEPWDVHGTPNYRIRTECLVGNELRILLETVVYFRPLTSHSSKASSAKGWLITVDLAKQGPLSGRSRVYGPLWDVPNVRSSLSFDVGAHFTDQDVAAARATPFIDFDWDGTPVQIRRDQHGHGIRERLVLGATPRWKPDGSFSPLPAPGPPMNEETVETLSGRYHLQLSDGHTTVHERLTGKRIVDPWLEKAFTTYRNIKELKNVRTWLTDDLQYLVCNPQPVYLEVRGDPRDFEYAGKTYRRGEYVLVWQRPNPEPRIVKKPRAETPQILEPIVAAFSIKGVLYFLYEEGRLNIGPDEKPAATLIPAFGGKTYAAQSPADRRAEWEYRCPRQRQQLEKPARLAFFGTNRFGAQAPDQVPDQSVTVFIWTLENAKVSVFDAPTSGLFERQSGEYVPKQALAVGSPEGGRQHTSEEAKP
jgi:hypothetical protein